jgi:hypothetical protein
MKKLYELKAELECELLRNGKTVQVLKQDCQSFTKWFKHGLSAVLTTAGRRGWANVPIRDISGVDQTLYWYTEYQDYGTWFDVVENIGIGTSDAPFDYTQHQLQSLLMYATGLTKSIDCQDWDSSVRFEITGTFNIQTEADVKETALYGKAIKGYHDYFTYMVSRDILSSPIHVIPGDVLIVRYRITIS